MSATHGEERMAVREGLLALLDDGPAYGYQLKSGFETATGGVWPLNVGQVYSTLDRLVRDGLVTAREQDGQRSYRLAAPGSEALGAWWDAVPADEPPPRDELILKVLLAVSRGREHALDVLTNQRSALLALLQRRRQSSRAKPKGGLAADLVEDALVVRAEADLRWLDLCEERLLAENEERQP
jgi:DNA-binding PadR family transcriptional regulator